jgi:CHAT domain-containing protein
LLAGKHTAEQVATIIREIDEASEELELVQSRIRELSPRYAALTAPRSLSVREIQALLDPQTVLLEYSLGEERSYVWAITSESVAVRELPRRSAIETLARRGYEELSRSRTRGRIERSSLPKLSAAVLATVADLLDRERIVIAADGALQIVPFAALPAPQTNAPLLVDHEVVSIPSASVLELLRSQPKHRAHSKLLAVIADPVFDREDPRVNVRGHAIAAESSAESSLTRSILDLGGGVTRLPRLPFTRREAQGLEALVPESSAREIALDFRANRSAVTRGNLADYRFVHFATHGILDTVHPELSGLVFSLVDARGRDQDGFLPAVEVFNLNLPAELVVLSACQTALGKEIRGEGIVGLTRAFMYAGSPRVVASLWRVDDAATAALMKRFYEAMLGPKKLRPAAALREAQLAVSRQKRWEDPYYWAGFVLQGEWR